ncbi:MAG TPA: DUF3618 domain-containing protein [Candidatus Angelobacter sp.]|nr:DUF3618 domain-containing protein [Candidatus Angelobacter sp.]
MTLDRDDDIRLADEEAAQADLEVEATDADDADSEEIEVAEIRAEIEEARVEMGGTLNELGDRLDPGNLMNEAKDNVREATIGRVEETAKGLSDMVMETIKRNPIPAAMAGAGLALLWMNRSESGNGNGRQHTNRYDPMYGTTSSYGQASGRHGGGVEQGIGTRAGEAIGAVGENVGDAVGQVGQAAQNVTGEVIERGQQTAQEVGWRLERFMRASPLAVGAIAVGAGALVGALVPETQQEREMLGDASRQVGEAVRDTVSQAGQQAESAINDAERSMSQSGASR